MEGRSGVRKRRNGDLRAAGASAYHLLHADPRDRVVHYDNASLQSGQWKCRDHPHDADEKQRDSTVLDPPDHSRSVCGLPFHA